MKNTDPLLRLRPLPEARLREVGFGAAPPDTNHAPLAPHPPNPLPTARSAGIRWAMAGRWASLLLFCALAPIWLRAQGGYPTPFAFSTLELSAQVTALDGLGSEARFGPLGYVAVDRAGNVYVSDRTNFAIRKITPAGVVTTFAGLPGFSGATDGSIEAARFGSVAGLAFDSAGNLFVADASNFTIRKITPAGLVSTFAGSPGLSGAVDGDGGAARFGSPAGLAFDAGGNLYVADDGNDTVRKITPAGGVSTLALVNTRQPGGNSTLRGIAVDVSGNVFVAESYSFSQTLGSQVFFNASASIHRISPAGARSTWVDLGSSNISGIPVSARPFGVAMDANGNLYVADGGRNIVLKYSPDAVLLSTVAGVSGAVGAVDGPGGEARFQEPAGLALDSTGNLYVADSLNSTLRKIAPTGVVSTLAGTAGPVAGTDRSAPTAIAVDGAGNLYIAESFTGTIRRVSPNGACFTLAGPGINERFGWVDGTAAAARFREPSGIAVDQAGNVYVADRLNHAIRKITPGGVVSTLAGGPTNEPRKDGPGSVAGFYQPEGVAVDGSGNLFVADTGSHSIRKITPTGVVTTLAGGSGQPGGRDGAGPVAQFYSPSGLVVDRDGTVYVADTFNRVIRKVTPSGIVTTLAGVADPFRLNDGSLVDGPGSAARFGRPTGISIDSAGNLYVADANKDGGFHVIRKVTPAGQVSTLAGSAASSGASDGIGSTVRFKNPRGVAQFAGNLYVADSGNNAIRVGANDCALINVSVRSTLAARQTLIVGFAMTGGTKPVLVRAVGPGLGQFGVGGFVNDPALAIFAGPTRIDGNEDWGGSRTLSDAFARVGAFGLPPTSPDAALLRGVAGANTALVTGTSAGSVLVEIYDAGAGLIPRLTNLSTRNVVGTGGDILIAGFVISGTSPKNLLVRAIGPTLADFGVSGALVDPRLEVFADGTKQAENDNWSADLAGVFTSAGAFALAPGSRDAAVAVTLVPGSYTVQVSGVAGATGEALLEVYELP